MTVAHGGAAVTPGACVDGRYRLDRRHASGPGWSVWRGLDELLERPIAVQVFEPGRSRLPEVFEAVRRVSRVTHGGLAQVFDANEDADPPYLVSEWVGGRSLADALADGPLDPGRVAEAFCQVSAALSVAHSAGVAHLRLRPRSIVWSPSGHVKVVGLGVEAELDEVRSDDPVRTDTQDLGRLLRLALTGRSAPGEPPPSWRFGVRAWRRCRHGLGRELLVIADRATGDADRPIPSIVRLAEELRRVTATHVRRPIVPAALTVSDPIPGLVRVRTRDDAPVASTAQLRAAREDAVPHELAA